MPVQLPSLNELAQMEFMSPMAFQQAQNQIGLGTQFAQQGLEQGAADLQAKSLANMFAEQANPLKVQQLGLQNEGMGYENTVKGVEARTQSELEEESKAAKRATLLEQASESELAQLTAKAQAMLMRTDQPELQAKGQKMLDASWAEQQRRNKAADELEKTKTIVGGRKVVAEINAASRKDSAQITADAKAAKGASATDFDALILKYAKNPVAQAELRISRAEMKAAQGDAAGAARELQLAAEARARAAEDVTNRGLATPGVDVATVANLPPSERPAAKAPVGTVGPTGQQPAPQRPSGPTNTSERSMAASVADTVRIPNPQEEIRRQQALIDSGALSPADKAVAQQYIADVKKKYNLDGQKAATPAVPQGRVAVVDANGKAFSIPEGQLEQALKQGYKRK